MSFAFDNRQFNSKAAYRKGRSHIILIEPAPVSANPISNFQVSKNSFGGAVMKNNFPITRPSSFLIFLTIFLISVGVFLTFNVCCQVA